jgi:hypothetical protein
MTQSAIRLQGRRATNLTCSCREFLEQQSGLLIRSLEGIRGELVLIEIELAIRRMDSRHMGRPDIPILNGMDD